MPRHTCIDREAYHERYALLLDAAEAEGELSNAALTRIAQQANTEASALPFSIAATAAANGNWQPAKDLCRREQERHGRAWAVDLWREIEAVVADARALDMQR